MLLGLDSSSIEDAFGALFRESIPATRPCLRMPHRLQVDNITVLVFLR